MWERCKNNDKKNVKIYQFKNWQATSLKILLLLFWLFFKTWKIKFSFTLKRKFLKRMWEKDKNSDKWDGSVLKRYLKNSWKNENNGKINVPFHIHFT